MIINLGPYLKAFLVADAPVEALIASRVYPLKAPQRPTLPLLLYRLSYEFERPLDGGRLAAASLTCSIVARDYDQAHSIADVVESAMEHALDGESALAWGTASVSQIIAEGRDDETAQLAEDEIIFAVTSRFGVTFS